MGCGKSKHAVVTATTVVKSKKSDDGKETRTTKTVTEKGDSVSVQEVETTSSVVEDTKKETTTTKIDPISTANAGASVAPALAGEEVVEDNDVACTDDVDTVKKEDEVVKDSNPTDANDAGAGDAVPASSEDNEGVEKDVREDDKKKESTIADEKEAKTEKVSPTLAENVREGTLVVKGDKRLKNLKEDMAYETPTKTTDEFLNNEYATPKVHDQIDVALAKESTKVETKKEEDVEVIGASIAKAETSSATEPKKVPTADEANATETKEKET